MAGIDAELIDLGNGIYDIQIDDFGDIKSQDFFDTAIIVSLLGERRAPASQVPNPRRRRGWIGNEGTNFEIGSLMWLYEQSRLSRTTLRSLEVAAKDSLQWLVDDGLAVAIKTVSADIQDQSIRLEIGIERSVGEVENRSYRLWNNTGVS